MTYFYLAEFVLLAHFSFILFVIFGGLLVIKWKKVIWVHLPCLLWGIFIELAGWICPLTHLELYLRNRGGMAGYEGDFIGQYLLPIIYPGGLTSNIQVTLGICLLLFNLLVYTFIFHHWRK